MGNTNKLFYTTFYNRTNGFIPSKPLNQSVYPGDFFQIHNGEVVVLGNIFRNGLVMPEDINLQYGIKLNPINWDFNEGVKKIYSRREDGANGLDGEFEFCRQVLGFEKKGSFFFRGHDPESVKIANWSDLWQSLIIKMTQTQYSFRSVYVVTESVTTSNWTLAISNSKEGELEIAMNSENFGLVDIFGHSDAKTIQAKDIEYYNREEKRKPTFFKAKKLVVQDEKLNTFINDLIVDRSYQNEWASSFYDYPFYQDSMSYNSQIHMNSQASILDMLSSNQLNPNTALLYFRWEDVNLDDIEKLFINYG